MDLHACTYTTHRYGCDEGAFSPIGLLCGPGKYNEERLGGVQFAALAEGVPCKACPAGTSSTRGAVICLSCAAGTYASSGECFECAQGRYGSGPETSPSCTGPCAWNGRGSRLWLAHAYFSDDRRSRYGRRNGLWPTSQH